MLSISSVITASLEQICRATGWRLIPIPPARYAGLPKAHRDQDTGSSAPSRILYRSDCRLTAFRDVMRPLRITPAWTLLTDYSQSNATPHLLPIAVCQPANNSHIALQQCNHVQPKTGRRVQPRRFPVADITIGRGQGIRRLRGGQPEDDIGTMTLIDGRGQDHSRPDLRNPRSWERRDYDVTRPQVPCRSRSSNFDNDAVRTSARSSSVHVSDQSHVGAISEIAKLRYPCDDVIGYARWQRAQRLH